MFPSLTPAWLSSALLSPSLFPPFFGKGCQPISSFVCLCVRNLSHCYPHSLPPGKSSWAVPKVVCLFQKVSKIDIVTPGDLNVTKRTAKIGSKTFIIWFCNRAKQKKSWQPIEFLFGDVDLSTKILALPNTISLTCSVATGWHFSDNKIQIILQVYIKSLKNQHIFYKTIFLMRLARCPMALCGARSAYLLSSSKN